MVIIHTIWLGMAALLVSYLLMHNGPASAPLFARTWFFLPAELLIGFRLSVVVYVSGFFISVILLRVLGVSAADLASARWTFVGMSLLLMAICWLSEWLMAPTISGLLGPPMAWLGVGSGWDMAACAG